MIEKTKYELDLLIKECGKDKEAINMQKIINNNVLEIVRKFCEIWHSGMSAEYEIDLIMKVLRQQNLTKLTLNDDEFIEVSDGVYQNKRDCRIFKSKDRFDGKAYNVETMQKI
ncbi:MAG: hypothetical protein RR290_00635 [Clostridia bacterium]